MAIAFYTCLVASVALTWHGHRSADGERKERDARRTEAEQKLITQSRELQQQSEILRDLVQTLPPKDILARWADLITSFQGIYGEATQLHPTDPHTAERVRSAIRTVLGGIADLFRVYENAPPGCVIAANLMVFVPREGLLQMDVPAQREFETTLIFSSSGTTIENLDGVLTLVEPLSTRTDLPEDTADDRLVPLVLPIPRERHVEVANGKQATRVLPGAPYAWVNPPAIGYASHERLLRWCRENGAYSGEVIQALRHYLDHGAGRHVQSFVSIALPPARGSGNPVGVLNVHSSQQGLLQDRRPEENLYVLLQPALELLVELLALLQEAEQYESPQQLTNGNALA